MRYSWLAVALAAVALALVAAGSATAEEPEPSPWAPATVEGDPAGVGFVAGEGVVYGTTDAGGLGQDPNVACSVQDGDADLFVFTFPNATGCVDAVDASGQQVGREGVTALASAEDRGRIVVGLSPSDSPQAINADLVAYDVENGSLTRAFARGTGGPVLELDTDADGERFLAAAQNGPRPAEASYRLHVLGPDGDRLERFALKGFVRDVAISENARWAAVGGNYTTQGTTFGWVHLYDLSRSADQNPVLEREFQRPRGGTVTSVAVTDDGRLYTGHLDGEVTVPRTDATDQTLTVANASASVAVSSDGTVAAAGAGSTLVRLSGAPARLDTAWSTQLNGTSPDVEVRSPYVYAFTADVEAFDDRGQPLFTIPGGPVAAVNGTGLGLAIGQTGAPGTTGAQTSQLSAFELDRNASIEFPDPTPTISPGGVGLVNVTLTNEGAAVLNATIAQADDETIEVSPALERFRLLPGTERTIQATLSVPRDTPPGPQNVTVDVLSRPRVNTTGNLTVDVGTQTEVSVALEPGTIEDRTVVQGQSLTVRFLVRNQGNADAEVRLNALQAVSDGPTWPIKLSPDGKITVPPNTRTTARLDVTVPQDVPNGTRNRFVFRAGTDAGVSAATVTFTVNPFEALSLSPQSITKQMAPGATQSYTYELSNPGSVAANVTIDAQALDENGSAYVPSQWGVVLQRSQVVLEPGETRTVTLEITGPTNATEGESLRVQVLAATGDGTRASSLAYGVVDPALAEPPEEQPKRDPIPVWAPLVALLAAGVLLRRGDYDNL